VCTSQQVSLSTLAMVLQTTISVLKNAITELCWFICNFSHQLFDKCGGSSGWSRSESSLEHSLSEVVLSPSAPMLLHFALSFACNACNLVSMFRYWNVPLSSPNGSWKVNCHLTWWSSFKSSQYTTLYEWCDLRSDPWHTNSCMSQTCLYSMGYWEMQWRTQGNKKNNYQ